ncbi:MAG TPA: F0F1 ATP synthase subunit B [Anaerolineales bacterium]|nr:F0F1 ATP synthase subunit B [Anaerolineales bacterium]
MDALAPLGINLTFLISQIVNFLLLLIILRLWAWKPILRMLETRRERIAQGLEDARIAAEARANAEKEAQAILARAQQEGEQRIREAAERAEQLGKELRTSAEKDAVGVRETAAVEAEQTRTQALTELRGQVAALAIAAAQKIIGEALDEKRQRSLVSEFFSGLQGGGVLGFDMPPLLGASAEVTSALPLTEEEQDKVRQQIAGRLGPGASLSFRVNPNILGGLVVRVGDKVIDGSVAGKLEGLRQSLK